MKTSCGLIITNRNQLLLCHVTGQVQWDIPKGVMEEKETPLETALRETEEETGLELYDRKDQIIDLGIFDYLPYKNLHLFLFIIDTLPDCSRMNCRSTFFNKEGIEKPEMDNFRYVSFKEISTYASKIMAPVLLKIIDTMGLM